MKWVWESINIHRDFVNIHGNGVDNSNNNNNNNNPITWNWVCKQFISLLNEYPEGITLSILKSDLQLKCEQLIKLHKSDDEITSFNKSGSKFTPLYKSFRKDEIPFDSVIETDILDIGLLNVNNNQESQQQQLVVLSLGENLPTIDSNNNNKEQHQNRQHTIEKKINSNIIMKMILSPKYYHFLNEYFGEDPLISRGRKIRFTAISIAHFNLSTTERDSGQLRNSNETENEEYQINLLPTEIISFLLRGQYEFSYREKTSHYPITSILNGRYPGINSIFFLKVIEIYPEEKVHQIKWANQKAHDNYLDHYLKQVVLLSSPNNIGSSNNSIQLIFWDNETRFTQLFQIGDNIRLQGIFFNTTTKDLEFLSTSTICILPKESQQLQQQQDQIMKPTQTPTTATFSQAIASTNISVDTDMSFSFPSSIGSQLVTNLSNQNCRVRISNICGSKLKGVSLLVYVISMVSNNNNQNQNSIYCVVKDYLDENSTDSSNSNGANEPVVDQNNNNNSLLLIELCCDRYQGGSYCIVSSLPRNTSNFRYWRI
eukprot:gene8545-10506_t